jgi:hypothetical protein
MNKVKKYTLDQLSKVQPLLNDTELLCILGGYEKEDETYYYFSAHEIRQMFPSGNIPSVFESYWEKEESDDGSGSFTLIHYYRIKKEDYNKLYGSESSEISGSDNETSETSNDSSEASEGSDNTNSSASSSGSSNVESETYEYMVNRIFMTILYVANKSSVSSVFENRIKNAIKSILNSQDVSAFMISIKQIENNVTVSFTDKIINNNLGTIQVDFVNKTVESYK